MTKELLPVTQEDREAAADLMQSIPFGGMVGSVEVVEGGNDSHYFVQAFARYRLNTHPHDAKPWGYGWYELGGKKMASGYLPTFRYPRSEDVSEGPFPLYRTHPHDALLKEARDLLAKYHGEQATLMVERIDAALSSEQEARDAK